MKEETEKEFWINCEVADVRRRYLKQNATRSLSTLP
jgi:hypothetical protein